MTNQTIPYILGQYSAIFGLGGLVGLGLYISKPGVIENIILLGAVAVLSFIGGKLIKEEEATKTDTK